MTPRRKLECSYSGATVANQATFKAWAGDESVFDFNFDEADGMALKNRASKTYLANCQNCFGNAVLYNNVATTRATLMWEANYAVHVLRPLIL